MKNRKISKVFLSIWILMLISFIISVLFGIFLRLIPEMFFYYKYAGYYDNVKVYNDPNTLFLIILILNNLISLTIFILFIVSLVLSAKNLNSSSGKAIAITTSIMGIVIKFLNSLFSIIYWRTGLPTLVTIIIALASLALFIISIVSWAKVKNSIKVPSNQPSFSDDKVVNNNTTVLEDNIRSLDKLFKESLITESEFKKAKKDLLDKVSEI